ncbi:hypothetical protein Tco_1435023, partial [Tanacetum coccineum]
GKEQPVSSGGKDQPVSSGGKDQPVSSGGKKQLLCKSLRDEGAAVESPKDQG